MPRIESRFLRLQAPLLILVGVIFAIWIGQASGPDGWDEPFMVVPERVATSWDALRAGGFSATDLAPFGTLLSHAFLHGDIEHVVFNMIYLWIFAALAVEHLGRRWFALVFVVAAVAGGVGHVLLDPSRSIPMLGASGAVMGFEGLYLGLAMRFSLPNPRVWPLAHPIAPLQLAAIAVLGIIYDFHDVLAGRETFIANGAHIGGFVAGLFVATVLPARSVRDQR